MTIQFWVSEAQAREMGCTHKARIFGIIPGFWNDDMHSWVSRSDILNPVEDALGWLWSAAWSAMHGDEEMETMFSLGARIDGREDAE